jgi:hypothetical protein
MSRKLSGKLIIDLKRELDPNAKKPAARSSSPPIGGRKIRAYLTGCEEEVGIEAEGKPGDNSLSVLVFAHPCARRVRCHSAVFPLFGFAGHY